MAETTSVTIDISLDVDFPSVDYDELVNSLGSEDLVLKLISSSIHTMMEDSVNEESRINYVTTYKDSMEGWDSF